MRHLTLVLAIVASLILAAQVVPSKARPDGGHPPNHIASHPTPDQRVVPPPDTLVETRPFNVVAHGPLTWNLRIVGAEGGAPIVGARIYEVRHPPGPLAHARLLGTTGKDGQARVERGDVILACAEGYAAEVAWAPQLDAASSSVECPHDIVLQLHAGLEGVVRDESGAGISNVRLEIVNGSDPLGRSEGGADEESLVDCGRRSVVRTDAQGRYRVSGLRPGPVHIELRTRRFLVADRSQLVSNLSPGKIQTRDLEVRGLVLGAVVLEGPVRGRRVQKIAGAEEQLETVNSVGAAAGFPSYPTQYQDLVHALTSRCAGAGFQKPSMTVVPVVALGKPRTVTMTVLVGDERFEGMRVPLVPLEDFDPHRCARILVGKTPRSRWGSLSLGFTSPDGASRNVPAFLLHNKQAGEEFEWSTRFGAPLVDGRIRCSLPEGDYICKPTLSSTGGTKTFAPFSVSILPAQEVPVTVALTEPVTALRVRVEDAFGRRVDRYSIGVGGHNAMVYGMDRDYLLESNQSTVELHVAPLIETSGSFSRLITRTVSLTPGTITETTIRLPWTMEFKPLGFSNANELQTSRLRD